MNTFYNELFKVHSYDVDFNNNLKISTFFKYMQDAAANHSINLKCSYYDLIEQNLMWVISRASLEIIRYPIFGEQIKVKTWVKGSDKAFVLRDFIIYDDNENIIAKATTSWLIITIDKKRPQKPKVILNNISIESNEFGLSEIPDKITESVVLDYIYNYVISYSSIDINQHVNNTKYIDILIDSFSQEMFTNNSINFFQINFLSECTYGNNLLINKGKFNEDTKSYYIEAFNEDTNKKVTQAIANWK